MESHPRKLLDPVRDAIRLKHYAYRTEETYAQSIGRYILLRDKRHPKDMGITEVEAFLTYLAVEGQEVKTTLIYTHLLNRSNRGVRSPFDLGRVRPLKTHHKGSRPSSGGVTEELPRSIDYLGTHTIG